MSLAALEPSVSALGARLASAPSPQPLSTPSPVLNQLLTPLLTAPCLLEIFGAPSSARTSLSLSLAASALSQGSSVIYADADGGVIPARVRTVVAAAVGASAVDAALSRWRAVRICSWTDLAAGLVHVLPGLADDMPGLALVVVDSFAVPFRAAQMDRPHQRLEAFAARMADLAMRRRVVVVLVNCARPVSAAGEACPYSARTLRGAGLAGAGEAWAHVCPERVALGWEDGHRVAWVVKSARVPCGEARFRVTEGGVGDVEGEGEE